MKATIDTKGVYLEYELKRDEYSAFLRQVQIYKKANVKIELFDGGTEKNSWIKAPEWRRGLVSS